MLIEWHSTSSQSHTPRLPMHPQSLQGSNFQLHSLPILVGKLDSSSFLQTWIIQLACRRISLQKQGMNIAHNELIWWTVLLLNTSLLLQMIADIVVQRRSSLWAMYIPLFLKAHAAANKLNNPSWKEAAWGDMHLEGVDFFETYAPVVQWRQFC